MFFQIIGKDIFQEIETATRFPAKCVICFFEHKLDVVSNNKEEALAHRTEKHDWVNRMKEDANA